MCCGMQQPKIEPLLGPIIQVIKVLLLKSICKAAQLFVLLFILRKLDRIPLISQGWGHRKANGDYFIINSHGSNPSILEDDDIDFSSLKLNDTLVANLSKMGLTKPTLIQKMATKSVLKGENCLIAAETGSGKTVSYLAPIVQNVCDHKLNYLGEVPLNSPLAVVITPGRELSEQVFQVSENMTAGLPIISRCITGGRLKRDTLNADFKEVDILFASMGALSKMITHRIYNMSRVQHLVLDESDTLLDDSFNDKMLYILRKFPLQTTTPVTGFKEGVQLVMASATIPRSVEQILGEIVPYSSFAKITTEQLHRLLPHVIQRFYKLSYLDKPARLLELVKKETSRQVILSDNFRVNVTRC